MKQFPIIIIDFGSQYTQLVARRIRELGVYCEIYPYDVGIDILKARTPCGFILSGGPSTVTSITTPRAPTWIFESGLPILGICYGMQTMAAQLGGEVISSAIREFGSAPLRLHEKTRLFKPIEARFLSNSDACMDVWMSHGDKVTQLPSGFKIICETPNAPIAGMADESNQWYGVQFHPEVTHTQHGLDILRQFVIDICGAKATWTPQTIIEDIIGDIRQQVGKEDVLLGLSGGVDSAVVAALLHRAIGEQLICVFVDTGLLRQNEAADVMAMFSNMGIRIVMVQAEERFLRALEGVTCPETKRKTIGHVFVQVFEEESKRIPSIAWLAQGTIYPDVIESAATANKGAEVIKSHHNVGGLPKNMPLKLLEPIRELFKDEVRQIGLQLGLPSEMVYRHPFPGPGLGVRILGEVKKEYADLLRQADAIFLEELRTAELYSKVSQAFAVFLPIKSVGVVGDARRYDYVICLRAVKTVDFMTAEWAQLPWAFLALVSNRIMNEMKGISRVTYDISGKPPATIEWE